MAVVVEGVVVVVPEVPAAPVVDVAVAIVVEAVAATAGAVLAGIHPHVGREVGMGRVDAGVDDADHDVRKPRADVPGLRGVHVSVRKPRRTVHGLARVLQAPELREEGIVRRPGRAQEVVRLRVANTRIGVQACDCRPDPCRFDLHDGRANAAEGAQATNAEPLEQGGPLARPKAGLPSDDQLSGNGPDGGSKTFRIRARSPGPSACAREEAGKDGEGADAAAADHRSHRRRRCAGERPPFGEPQAPRTGTGRAGVSS
jgi:hypothetical protein